MTLSRLPGVAACAALAAVSFGTARARVFDVDELEHLHAAWCWTRGLVPYRDFFEHHGPLLYALLAPFLRWSGADGDADAVVRFLHGARVGAWGVAWAAAGLTAALGWRWRNGRTAALALAAVVGTAFFWQKALEVRPDGLALLLVLLAAGGLTRALRATSGGPGLLGPGLALGAAVLFSPKILFLLPGFGVGLAFLLRKRGKQVLLFIAGAATAPGVAALVFTGLGAFQPFWNGVVTVNAHWPVRFSAGIVLRAIGEQTPWLLPVVALGAVRGAGRAASPADAFVLALFLSGVAGLVVIPVPYPQTFLMVLPFGALLAARLADDLLERGGRRWRFLKTPWPSSLALALSAAAGLSSLAVPPPDANTVQLELIRRVHVLAGEGTVLDGWTGLGVFRPHALRHFFLHREIHPLIPAGEREAWEADLRAGRFAPAVVILDDDLRLFSPAIAAFVESRYRPDRGNVIWVRPGDGETRF